MTDPSLPARPTRKIAMHIPPSFDVDPRAKSLDVLYTVRMSHFHVARMYGSKPRRMLMYTYDETEAAMCLWEECIHRKVARDDDMFDWLAGGEGAACARGQCIELAKDVEESYNVAKAFGFDECFDWEFVPFWVDLAMEITEEHSLTQPWLNYIGYKAAKWAKERWG